MNLSLLKEVNIPSYSDDTMYKVMIIKSKVSFNNYYHAVCHKPFFFLVDAYLEEDLYPLIEEQIMGYRKFVGVS